MGTERHPTRPQAGASLAAASKQAQQSPAWLHRILAWCGHWLRGPRDLPGSPFVAARRRLILTNVVVVCAVLTILGVVVYFFNARTAQQEVDAQLQHYATTGVQSVINNQFVAPQPSQGEDHHNPQSLVPYSPNTPDIFTVVLDAKGNPVADFDHVRQLGVPAVSFANTILRSNQQSGAITVHANGHDYRLYAAKAVNHDQDEGIVVAGISLYLQNEQQINLIRALAIVYVAVLLATVVSSLILTERALGPARLAFARQRQFATAASHELKTPLAVIRSEVELASGLMSDSLALLGDRSPNLPQVRRHLEEARGETNAATAEVDFMTRLVQELLLLARDASDRLALSQTTLDLRALVAEVTDRVRPIAEADHLTLHASALASGNQESLWVHGDAGLLRQLLYGLLENAVRYTPAGGSIWVEVRDEGRAHLLGDHRRHAVIEIRDTGIGIAPKHLANIFEPFYRAVSSTRPLHGEQHGTGLGLAMAQWIVRAHGGTIGVRSTEGQGTIVTVELPRTSQDQPADAAKARPATPGVPADNAARV